MNIHVYNQLNVLTAHAVRLQVEPGLLITVSLLLIPSLDTVYCIIYVQEILL